ncbi:MAG: hypothetical protein ACLFN2_08005 [Bacteroidales bacterium]
MKIRLPSPLFFTLTLILSLSLPMGVVGDEGPPPPPSWGVTGDYFDVKVFLEGPYRTADGEMVTTLRDEELIPAEQPYNQEPWNYSGTEAVETKADVPEGTVDWVLVELRDAESAEDALEVEPTGVFAAFLQYNGQLIGPMGDMILFDVEEPVHGYYIVIRHRNHMDVMSSNSLVYDPIEERYSYVFSDDLNKAYRGDAGYHRIDPNDPIFGMVAADGMGDGNVFAPDFDFWNANAGPINVYHSADYNLDGNIFSTDFDVWYRNAGKLNPL